MDILTPLLHKHRKFLPLLLICLLAACSNASSPELSGTAWRLDHIRLEDDQLLEPLPAARYSLSFDDRQISGMADCNAFGASYRLQQDQMTIGEVEMTAQDCGAESQRISQVMFAVLQAAPQVELQGEQLVFRTSQAALSFSLLPELTHAESAVLDALLSQWIQPSETLLLLDQTAYNLPGASLPATMQAVEAEFASLGQGEASPPLDQLIADFSAKNAVPQPLSDWLESDWQVEFLDPQRLPELQADNYQALLQEYPQASGLFVLSRPGFNPAGDQALVYLARLRPDDAAGYYTLLELHDGLWQSTLGFRLGR